MDAILIHGGVPLKGDVDVYGAKNAALPILCATILTAGQCTFENVPKLHDIRTMVAVLEALGLRISGRRRMRVDGSELNHFEAPYELVRTMRASVLVLGPLLARYGRARVSLPGGCAIGARPIDQHIKGLSAMGARIDTKHGYVEGRCRRLKGARIVCDLVTVTGTMNLMMAATLAKGVTVIENAAREPEVAELAHVLTQMGAQIQGAGTARIEVDGVEQLNPIKHRIMPDRIEAGTFMVAAAATEGDVCVNHCLPEHLSALIDKLGEAGAQVEVGDGSVRVIGKRPVRPVEIRTSPHPGFPTDMQAQFMVLCALAEGESRVTETIFENRFMHVPELCRMNAQIRVSGAHRAGPWSRPLYCGQCDGFRPPRIGGADSGRTGGTGWRHPGEAGLPLRPRLRADRASVASTGGACPAD